MKINFCKLLQTANGRDTQVHSTGNRLAFSDRPKAINIIRAARALPSPQHGPHNEGGGDSELLVGGLVGNLSMRPPKGIYILMLHTGQDVLKLEVSYVVFPHHPRS